jgi:hypothetical protein
MLSGPRERVRWSRTHALSGETFDFPRIRGEPRAPRSAGDARSAQAMSERDDIVVRALGRTDYEAALARDARVHRRAARYARRGGLTEHARSHARPRRPSQHLRAPARFR